MTVYVNCIEKKQISYSWFPVAGGVNWDWLQMGSMEFYGINNVLKLVCGDGGPALQIYIKNIELYSYDTVIFWYIPIKLLKMI